MKNKIEFLKSKWKKFGKVAERKARDNALLLAAGAAATLVPVNMGHNKTDSSNETGNLIERLQNTILSPEKVKIVPEKVISDDNLIEFHNKAQDSKGREIKDFVGATPYSIWDVTYKREVGTQENPVGVFESFAGTMQYNKANVQSMLMYALMHEDYNAWAKQFFEDTPEAKKAVAEMKEAYEEKGSLTVYTQDMGGIGNLILIDEADETVSYDYTYSPYSESDDVRGCFMTSNIMYIEETQQLIFTFRVNRSASEAVMNKYSLESKPGKDSYSFVLSDGENYYTEYDYLTASRGTYFYYRVVFTGVEYTHVDKPYNSPLSGVTELSLSVYYDDLKNFDSPLDTMTLANNLLSAEKFELKKALPAEKPDGLMSYVSFELD